MRRESGWHSLKISSIRGGALCRVFRSTKQPAAAALRQPTKKVCLGLNVVYRDGVSSRVSFEASSCINQYCSELDR